VRYRVRAGRRVTLRARIAGAPGRYRYQVRLGRRVLRRGRATLKASPGVSVLVPQGRKLLVTRTR
jgi:hypothetical protein